MRRAICRAMCRESHGHRDARASCTACGMQRSIVLRAFLVAFALSAPLPVHAQAATPRSPISGAAPSVRTDVQAGVVVRPDTVTVGDPFTITVRVRVPVTALVRWPALDDTAAKIALRAPMQRRDGPTDVSGREEIAEFEVAAWDTGRVTTQWPPVTVIVGSDTVNISLAEAGIVVRSVLSADTAEHVPRPAKPVFEQAVPWWQRWWLAALVFAALATLAYLLWRRRHRAVVSVAGPRLGPYEHAMHAFDRLERLALSDAGEHGRASVLAIDILRGYLSARIPITSRAQTSAELLASVGDDTRIPLTRLIQLLVHTDAVKFARRRVTHEEARAMTAEARAIVESVEDVERVRRAQAEAAARAQAERATDVAAPPNRREPTGVA